MPRIEVAAKRYAQAIFEIARDEGALERWQTDLDALTALVAEATVAEFLLSSKVGEAQKFAVLDQALAGSDVKMVSLAKLLVRKQRIGISDQIAEAFREMWNKERGLAIATVTTAVPLNDEGRNAVVTAIRRLTDASEVQLAESVDREILGGAIVRIGDHIIDGSVRTRLSGLRRNIAGSMG